MTPFTMTPKAESRIKIRKTKSYVSFKYYLRIGQISTTDESPSDKSYLSEGNKDWVSLSSRETKMCRLTKDTTRSEES